MKKFFLSLAVLVMALCANAQTNQYFWYNGNLMMGNPIAQIDSVTFGEGEPADTLHILLPRTIIKEVHDTVYITIHDTVCPNAEHNGYRYVDLGLSVMWADANVGADNPEDYGNYYCWAETSPRDNYGFYNYKYGGYTTMYKYVTNQSSSYYDGLTRLTQEDDAASVNMGGIWRTPTKAEWQELIDNCTLTYDTINSHPGLRFTAFNGKSIFIPCSGNMWSTSRDNSGDGFFYWSSDLSDSDDWSGYAFTTQLHENNGKSFDMESWNRQIGGTVRGVFSK